MSASHKGNHNDYRRSTFNGQFINEQHIYQCDNSAHGDPTQHNSHALQLLSDLSKGATAAGGYVMPREEGRTDGVMLDRESVYVPRAIEDKALERVRAMSTTSSPGGAVVIYGEPGSGKSCLLWSLRNRLEEDGSQAFLIQATHLRTPSSDRNDDGLDVATLTDALQEARRNGPVFLLLDTIDQLLHSPENRASTVSLLNQLGRSGIPVIIGCRSREWQAVKSEIETPPRERLKLDDFDDEELTEAVKKYARIFYRSPGQKGPSAGITTANSHTDYEHTEISSGLLSAIARGLPVADVCRRPIRLRMLFELYSPRAPEQNIDAGELYRRYWDIRVTRDQRSFHQLGKVEASAEQGAENRRVEDSAREIGAIMLAHGTTEINNNQAMEDLVLRFEGTPVNRPLETLVRRGIITRIPGKDVLSFFHQTFAEHAAGRAFARHSYEGMSLLTKRIVQHPYDLYVGEAAMHAFSLLDSKPAGLSDEVSSLLESLLSRDVDPLVTEQALKIYGQLSRPGEKLQQAAHSMLTKASSKVIVQYLQDLNTLSRLDPRRWTNELEIGWNCDDVLARRWVLEALGQLSHSYKSDVRSFLHAKKIPDITQTILWSTDTYNRLPRLIRRFHHVDQKWARNLVDELWDLGGKRTEGKRGDNSALLRWLLTSGKELSHSGSIHGRSIARTLFTRLNKPITVNNAEAIIHNAADLWSSLPENSSQRPEHTLRSAVELAQRININTDPCLADKAILLSLARRVAASPDDPRPIVETFLKVNTKAASAAIAHWFLSPLLTIEHTTPMIGRARASHLCAEILSQVHSNSQLSAQTILSSLVLGDMPSRIIAGCLPEKPSVGLRADDEAPSPWLLPPWPIQVTVRAAAGGHHYARVALRDWIDRRIWEYPNADTRSFRDELGQRFTELDGGVDLLNEEAKATGLLDTLLKAGKLVTELEERKELPDHVLDASLIALSKALTKKGNDPEFRRVGFDVARSQLNSRGVCPFTSAKEIAALLQGTRNPRVQRSVLSLTMAIIQHTPPLWVEDDIFDLTDALRSVREAGSELIKEHRWNDTDARTRIFNGNRAHEILVAFHACITPLDSFVETPLADISAEGPEVAITMAFEPLTDRLPPKDADSPGSKSERLRLLVPLLRRLTAEERTADAQYLLFEVAREVAEHDPKPNPKWKYKHANFWRIALRELAVACRPEIVDIIQMVGQKDISLAEQLLEVMSQSYASAASELRAVMALDSPDFPSTLKATARRISSWGGRINSPWPELLQDLPTSR